MFLICRIVNAGDEPVGIMSRNDSYALHVLGPDGEFTIGSGGTGQMTNKVRDKLVGLQKGRVEDTHGWTMKL